LSHLGPEIEQGPAERDSSWVEVRGFRTPGLFRAREVPLKPLTRGNARIPNPDRQFRYWLIVDNCGCFALFRVQNASWKRGSKTTSVMPA
jgi:hypothetical protein